MKYIVPVLCGVVMLIVIVGVVAFLRQPKETEKGKVHLPKIFVIIGGLAAVVFLIPALITYFNDEPLWVPLICLGLASLGTLLILGFVNCRITYDEDGFVYKTIFGRKLKYTYSQVTGIRKNMNEIYVYVGKRKLLVDALYIGGYDFIKQVKKKYREFNGGRNIPDVKPKHDIFNGHVNDVAGFWLANIIMTVLLIGSLIFMVCYVYLPKTESNTIKQSVTFTSYEEFEEYIALTSADEKIYEISFLDEQFNANEIKELCKGEKTVTVYSKEVNSDNGKEYFSLKAIKYKDNYILSFDETNRLHREEYWPLVIFAICMLLAWWGYTVASVIVGRNPQNFSKKVVRMFFKDGYIKY
ncbi:MAG: hypothetical protein J6D06_07945 [Clostridia bacterium]|nr:hypothetical protein [Clostridia bacterium]